MRSTTGPVTSTSRNAWTGSLRSTRSSCKSCGSSREHATRPVWLEHSGRNPARLATNRSRGCLMSSGYEVAQIDELEELPIAGGEFVWRPIRRRFGITAFGTNAYTGNAGQRVIEEHAERDNHQEMYVVLRGRATFTLEDDEIDAPAGTMVVLRPDPKRVAIAADAG